MALTQVYAALIALCCSGTCVVSVLFACLCFVYFQCSVYKLSYCLLTCILFTCWCFVYLLMLCLLTCILFACLCFVTCFVCDLFVFYLLTHVMFTYLYSVCLFVFCLLVLFCDLFMCFVYLLMFCLLFSFRSTRRGCNGVLYMVVGKCLWIQEQSLGSLWP